MGLAGVSNGSRGAFGGGTDWQPLKCYRLHHYCTTGNAIDFGDLTVARYQVTGISNLSRGIFSGGYTGAFQMLWITSLLPQQEMLLTLAT
jgi:hypothetical protein